MQGSKEFLKTHEILPKISFKDGKAHTVKLIQDKVDKIKDADGTEVEGVKYKVVEAGEVKTIFTSSVGLIQKLSEYAENSEVVIQMKSKKGEDGKWKSYYDVRLVGEDSDTPDDVPTIEDEEGFNQAFGDAGK